MLNKGKLLIETLKHLKFSQLFNQISNRLKSKAYIKNSRLGRGVSINLSLAFKTVSIEGKYFDRNCFSFLNLQKQFDSSIDWNYLDYGKLWNYNLEYFDYLHQEDVAVEEKLRLINDFYRFSVDHKRTLEPYPVSLRAINLVRFTCANKLGKKDFHDFLYKELAYLNSNYEYHILGNHLLENAFALCMGGAFFSNVDWHKRAVRILYTELTEQLHEDGAHFELSPMYHKIIFFRLLELIDWYSTYEKRDEAFVMFCRKKASLMLDWMENIRFENGDIPLFNDAANGIAYATSFLSDYAQRLGVHRSGISLNDSGYRSYKGNRYEIKMDLAQIGASYQPGHAHADALSFILYYKGKPLFVEQGTSTYQIGVRRDLERSTQAHNTVVVDGKNQSQVWGGFRVAQRAKTTLHVDEEGLYEASHNGYQSSGVIHRRRFGCEVGRLEVTDILSGHSGNTCYLHIHPDRSIEILAEHHYRIDKHVDIKLDGAKEVYLDSYDYADTYNQYHNAQRLVISFDRQLQTKILFED